MNLKFGIWNLELNCFNPGITIFTTFAFSGAFILLIWNLEFGITLRNRKLAFQFRVYRVEFGVVITTANLLVALPICQKPHFFLFLLFAAEFLLCSAIVF